MKINISLLQKKAKIIWKHYGRKIILSTVAIGTLLGGYSYYDTHVVKTSPEYAVEQLTKAVRTGDRNAVYNSVNIYGIIDETAKTIALINLKMEDWTNGSDALSANIEREKFVETVAENILSNINTEHAVKYTGSETDIIAKAIRMLGINDLSFETIQLTYDTGNMPVLDITVHDSKKVDVKYVIHIQLKQVDGRWKLDRLVSADTVIKTRLIDYKESLTEENRTTTNLFNKLIKIEEPNITIQDLPKPNLTPKELFNLNKEEKEKLFKLQSKLVLEAPIRLDPSVESAKVLVSFTDNTTGKIIKELPIDIPADTKVISYTHDVDYSDRSQEIAVDAIKNNKVATTIKVISVTTKEGVYSLKE